MYYTPRQPLQPLHPVCGAAISDDICSYIDEIDVQRDAGGLEHGHIEHQKAPLFGLGPVYRIWGRVCNCSRAKICRGRVFALPGGGENTIII